MFAILRRPKEVSCCSKIRTRETLYLRELMLVGEDPQFSSVLRQRVEKRRQGPSRVPTWPYQVKVIYWAGKAGIHFMETVHVSLDRGKHWSCFYDGNRQRTGERRVAGCMCFFLSDHELQVLNPTIERCEQLLQLDRLVRQGPAALPEVDDTEEALPLDFVDPLDLEDPDGDEPLNLHCEELCEVEVP